MILLDQKKYIINVDLNLSNQFDLEDEIIRNIFCVLAFTPLTPLVPQILLSSQIILQVALGDQLMTFEFIEG